MLDLLVPEGSENNNQHISENSAKNSLEESPSEKQRPLVKESSGPGTESSLAGLDKEDSQGTSAIDMDHAPGTGGLHHSLWMHPLL